MLRKLLFTKALIFLCALWLPAQDLYPEWVRGFGGTGIDWSRDMITNSAGEIYLVGNFAGTVDFDPGPGVTSITSKNFSQDFFLSKYSPQGNLIWVKTLGGNGNDQAYAITEGDSGSIYITGGYNALMDFDPGPNTFNRFPNGNFDIFLLKLDSAGNFRWAISMGGNFQDYGRDVAVDTSGNILVCGEFRSQIDFDPSSAYWGSIALGARDGFVAKYTSTGQFIWGENIGSSGSEAALAITVDEDDHIYIGGEFNGTSDFDPSSTIQNLVSSGGRDAFIFKSDASGNYIWAEDLDFGGDSRIKEVTVTENRDIIMAGEFENALDMQPGSGTILISGSGQQDIFVLRLDSNLNHQAHLSAGGINEDRLQQMRLDTAGNVFITGFFSDTINFSSVNSTQADLIAPGAGSEIFAARLDSSLETRWAVQLGGDEDDEGAAILPLADGSVLLSGHYKSQPADFYPGAGVDTLSSNSASILREDVYLLKLKSCADLQFSEAVNSCGPYTWPRNGQTYTSSGTYYDTVSGGGTCDSLYILQLNLGGTDSTIMQQNACGSYTWPATGITYQASGTYRDTTISFLGCDSINILQLQLSQSDSVYQSVTACDVYQWPLTNQSYSTGGIYSDTLQNSSGCDSVIFLDLTINSSSGAPVNVTTCKSYTWPLDGNTYTSSGVYTDTLTNQLGCDSLVSLILTLNRDTLISENINACGQYTWPVNGFTYNNSGQYYDSLSTAQGCDSVRQLNLTILQPDSVYQTVSACDSYTWSANGQPYQSSGIYQVLLINNTGCDSLVVLDLNLNRSSADTMAVQSCSDYTWNLTGQTYTSSGFYTDTLSTVNGCDSLVTLDLTLNLPDSVYQAVSACNSYLWPANGVSYGNSGIYSLVLTNSQGCDSTVVLDLELGISSTDSVNITSCGDYFWNVSGQVLNQGGVYRDTLSNKLGCDSVIILNLSIIRINTRVAFADSTLSAREGYDSYQWVRCDSSFLPVTGATDSLFSPLTNGSYAVVISQGNCTDTSDCFVVDGLAFDSFNSRLAVAIYPNPAHDLVNLEFMTKQAWVKVNLLTAEGRLIRRMENTATERLMLPLDQPPGSYFLQVITPLGRTTRPLIIEKH